MRVIKSGYGRLFDKVLHIVTPLYARFVLEPGGL